MKIAQFAIAALIALSLFGCSTAKDDLYPSQSEKGKCELRINDNNQLYCEQQSDCRGKCVLYSVPQGEPNAEWTIEEQPATPDSKKYYFCRCLEL